MAEFVEGQISFPPLNPANITAVNIALMSQILLGEIFDFSHFAKITDEEIQQIEKLVNTKIRENIIGNTELMTIDDAKKTGAMALFGEKYGDVVRVVTFDKNYSTELCGGCHVTSTGQIGYFKIISEGAVAAGIRRIEAVTASKADEYINAKLKMVDEVTTLLKSTGRITEGVEKLITEYNSLKKSVEKFQIQSATTSMKDLVDKAVNLNDIKFVSGQIETDSVDILKNVAYKIRTSSENTVFVIGSENGGKANILAMVSDDLVKSRNISAVAIIKEISGEINGGGGGQDLLATAGGKNPEGIQRALAKAAEYLRFFLSSGNLFIQ